MLWNKQNHSALYILITLSLKTFIYVYSRRNRKSSQVGNRKQLYTKVWWSINSSPIGVALKSCTSLGPFTFLPLRGHSVFLYTILFISVWICRYKCILLKSSKIKISIKTKTAHKTHLQNEDNNSTSFRIKRVNELVFVNYLEQCLVHMNHYIVVCVLK